MTPPQVLEVLRLEQIPIRCERGTLVFSPNDADQFTDELIEALQSGKRRILYALERRIPPDWAHPPYEVWWKGEDITSMMAWINECDQDERKKEEE